MDFDTDTPTHDFRCPTCGRFVSVVEGGFYSYPPGQFGDDEAGVVAYCTEFCAELARERTR